MRIIRIIIIDRITRSKNNGDARVQAQMNMVSELTENNCLSETRRKIISCAGAVRASTHTHTELIYLRIIDGKIIIY